MDSFISHHSVSNNFSQYNSAASAGFYGQICSNMKDLGSLRECVKNKANMIDSFHWYGYKLFLYQMQLLFVKNLTIRHYTNFPPRNFSQPDNESILGAQYLGEIEYSMIPTVLTYQRLQVVKYSTPYKYGYLCFYVRRPEVNKKKTTSK